MTTGSVSFIPVVRSRTPWIPSALVADQVARFFMLLNGSRFFHRLFRSISGSSPDRVGWWRPCGGDPRAPTGLRARRGRIPARQGGLTGAVRRGWRRRGSPIGRPGNAGLGSGAYERSAAGPCVGDRATCNGAVGLRNPAGGNRVGDFTQAIRGRSQHSSRGRDGPDVGNPWSMHRRLSPMENRGWHARYARDCPVMCISPNTRGGSESRPQHCCNRLRAHGSTTTSSGSVTRSAALACSGSVWEPSGFA